MPAAEPGATHLVTCLWKSVSCLCVTWMAPPVVSFGNPFSELSSQRQNVCAREREELRMWGPAWLPGPASVVVPAPQGPMLSLPSPGGRSA